MLVAYSMRFMHYSFLGCGKSSIMHLIERFYDVIEDAAGCADIESGIGKGCIKLDGVDLRDLNVRWLRSQIGLGMYSIFAHV